MEIPPLIAPPERGGKPSAVLILFADGPGGPDLLFIQRSAGPPAARGPARLPRRVHRRRRRRTGRGGAARGGRGGGRDPDGVDVVGTLPELYIPRTGFRVVPCSAWWRQPSAVAPVDAGEVAAVERSASPS
jgi:hypothetical protein